MFYLRKGRQSAETDVEKRTMMQAVAGRIQTMYIEAGGWMYRSQSQRNKPLVLRRQGVKKGNSYGLGLS